MIRETLNSGATDASVFYAGATGYLYFQDRPTTGATVSTAQGSYVGTAFPEWLEVVRAGNTRLWGTRFPGSEDSARRFTHPAAFQRPTVSSSPAGEYPKRVSQGMALPDQVPILRFDLDKHPVDGP